MRKIYNIDIRITDDSWTIFTMSAHDDAGKGTGIQTESGRNFDTFFRRIKKWMKKDTGFRTAPRSLLIGVGHRTGVDEATKPYALNVKIDPWGWSFSLYEKRIGEVMFAGVKCEQSWVRLEHTSGANRGDRIQRKLLSTRRRVLFQNRGLDGKSEDFNTLVSVNIHIPDMEGW